MKIPPIEWEDLYSMGLPRNAQIIVDGNTLVCDEAPKIIKQLLCFCLQNAPPEGDKLSYIRHIRDALMSFSDWTQVADSPLDLERKLAWAEYRQALRDLPSNYSSGPVLWPPIPQ